MTLTLLWPLSREEDARLYGSTNVGPYVRRYIVKNMSAQFIICICSLNYSFYLRDPKCLCLDNIEGFILNVPTEYKLGFVLLPLKRRHWIALKKIHGAFYNLDSKLDSPQLIGKVITIQWNLPKAYKGISIYFIRHINCIFSDIRTTTYSYI